MSAAQSVADRLAIDLVGDFEDPLTDELGSWIGGSRPFRAFAERHREKIRKKLRTATDVESRRDVRAELQVARLLLADRRLEIAFEGYGSTAGGPDFTVSLGPARMNLEVTRLRQRADADHLAGRMLVKLRQLPPSLPNAILFASTEPWPVDIGAAAALLQERDDDHASARGFPSARAMRQRMTRLSAVFAWSEAGPRATVAWINPTARIAAPERLLRACLACLA